MSDEMLTESGLRAVIREILAEVSGADALLLEKKPGETGWEKERAKKRSAKVDVRRKSDMEAEIDPPVSDVTKLKWKSKSAYVSRIVNAMSRADGHVPIAADALGMSTRQLYRHLHDPAVAAAEPERADPGPDPHWDVEAGKPESGGEREQKSARQRLGRKAAEDREERERE